MSWLLYIFIISFVPFILLLYLSISSTFYNSDRNTNELSEWNGEQKYRNVKRDMGVQKRAI